MSLLRVSHTRSDAALIGVPSLFNQTQGMNSAASDFAARLKEIILPTPTFVGTRVANAGSVDEKLYDALASFKVRTNQVAMHLDRDWRTAMFMQLDSLLGTENWEKEDVPPSLGSFSTFLRMLILLKPARRPGFGASATGILIATWTADSGQITMECLPKDAVRWNLAVTINDERERAAGVTPLARLKDVLSPYDLKR